MHVGSENKILRVAVLFEVGKHHVGELHDPSHRWVGPCSTLNTCVPRELLFRELRLEDWPHNSCVVSLAVVVDPVSFPEELPLLLHHVLVDVQLDGLSPLVDLLGAVVDVADGHHHRVGEADVLLFKLVRVC